MALIYHGTMDITTNSRCFFVHFLEVISHTNVSATANVMPVFITHRF